MEDVYLSSIQQNAYDGQVKIKKRTDNVWETFLVVYWEGIHGENVCDQLWNALLFYPM